MFGIYRWGWGFSTSQDFNGDIALIACFASAWTPAMVRRWHADPFGFLRPWNELPALFGSAPSSTPPSTGTGVVTFLMGNKLSRDRLPGVHLDLVLVVERAIQITTQDFWVQEGLRTRERQAALPDQAWCAPIPEMDAAFVTSGGGQPPAAARRPVVIVAGS